MSSIDPLGNARLELFARLTRRDVAERRAALAVVVLGTLGAAAAAADLGGGLDDAGELGVAHVLGDLLGDLGPLKRLGYRRCHGLGLVAQDAPGGAILAGAGARAGHFLGDGVSPAWARRDPIPSHDADIDADVAKPKAYDLGDLLLRHTVVVRLRHELGGLPTVIARRGLALVGGA